MDLYMDLYGLIGILYGCCMYLYMDLFMDLYGFYGIYMDVLSILYGLYIYKIHIESIEHPYGFYMDFIWIYMDL